MNSEGNIDGGTRDDVHAPEIRRFVVEVPWVISTVWERIVEGIQNLSSPFAEVLSETFQSMHFIAAEEDCLELLEVSNGLLIAHWFLTNVDGIVLQMLELFPTTTIPTDSYFPQSSTVLFRWIKLIEMGLASVEAISNEYVANFTSHVETKNHEGTLKDMGVKWDAVSPESTLVENDVFASTIPTATLIIGPLTIIALTCIMADNKFHLFATTFAPLVDGFMERIQSVFGVSRHRQQIQNQRQIPEEREESDGILWGILFLFCLETLLVGSIFVLMVLISVGLTLFGSLPAVVSLNNEFSTIPIEISKLLIGLLLSWVMSVLVTNVLRMAVYQTIDEDE